MNWWLWATVHEICTGKLAEGTVTRFVVDLEGNRRLRMAYHPEVHLQGTVASQNVVRVTTHGKCVTATRDVRVGGSGSAREVEILVLRQQLRVLESLESGSACGTSIG